MTALLRLSCTASSSCGGEAPPAQPCSSCQALLLVPPAAVLSAAIPAAGSAVQRWQVRRVSQQVSQRCVSSWLACCWSSSTATRATGWLPSGAWAWRCLAWLTGRGRTTRHSQALMGRQMRLLPVLTRPRLQQQQQTAGLLWWVHVAQQTLRRQLLQTCGCGSSWAGV
ncbi:hypothetical protein COO60DRAFT_1533185 [Scenedesmus sp. NREL 46B-D3]|nr:hypothetical protein COO60DRAFT_1533185 [Scenedesmus sp. NREL 46B-D3]